MLYLVGMLLRVQISRLLLLLLLMRLLWTSHCLPLSTEQVHRGQMA
jgi:hypothetical protein